MHESFLTYRQFLWLKIAIGASLLSLLAYALHTPPDGPNGGTWLGYGLGTAGAVLMVWLLWFGVRKRQYKAGLGMVGAWLSGHVYLGAALVVVATLHTGFHFGLNIHTLAYLLMMLVILSGFYGVYTYVRYPLLITANRAGGNRKEMMAEVADLDRESLSIADGLGEKVHQSVLRSIEQTMLGGTVLEQLGIRAQKNSLAIATERLKDLQRSLQSTPQIDPSATLTGSDATVMTYIVQHATPGAGGGARIEKMRQLMDLVSRKRALIERLQTDIRYHARMTFWLYFHVPVSVASVGAVLAHVVIVFFYR